MLIGVQCLQGGRQPWRQPLERGSEGAQAAANRDGSQPRASKKERLQRPARRRQPPSMGGCEWVGTSDESGADRVQL